MGEGERIVWESIDFVTFSLEVLLVSVEKTIGPIVESVPKIDDNKQEDNTGN